MEKVEISVINVGGPWEDQERWLWFADCAGNKDTVGESLKGVADYHNGMLFSWPGLASSWHHQVGCFPELQEIQERGKEYKTLFKGKLPVFKRKECIG